MGGEDSKFRVILREMRIVPYKRCPRSARSGDSQNEHIERRLREIQLLMMFGVHAALTTS